MIQSCIGHLEFQIDAKNMSFYKDLLGFLGWKPVYESPEVIGFTDAQGASLWFDEKRKDHANDYDGPGLNHLAFSATSVEDVDQAVQWLKERHITALFETPRHRPEFCGPGLTYYQVMFETPDRLLFEVVYRGPYSQN